MAYRFWFAVTAYAGLLMATAPAASYAPFTHGDLGAIAVDRSSLDTILRSQYGVDGGASLVIGGQEIRRWVAIGATREDFPPLRSLNHFQNPLLPWTEAGGVLGQSSVYWQQSPDQGIGGTWSWPIARQRLYDFLTLPSPAAREQALADTARALGQVMHMIQDAASPAHTRDDPHLIHDGYEARIEELRTSTDSSSRARFDALLADPSLVPGSGIFTLTDDPRAPAPIAKLIDSDSYRGNAATYGTGALAGLAEYTNGGYVSDDTIFLGFPLPRRESLGAPMFDPEPGAPGARRYFPKERDGEAIAHFVAEGALYERLLFWGQLLGGFILDDKVYEDYAAQLVPRAIGYSAGLLDYFFRGNFDFTVEPVNGDAERRLLTISIPPEAESMDGTFALYAEDRDGARAPIPGASLTTTLGRGGFAQALFTPIAGVRAYVLAFRGSLGREPDAVTGKVKPMGAVVSAVQAMVEFTDGEQRATVTDVDNASTLIVTERRWRDERRQRSSGTFVSSAAIEPGAHLKRVSLEFDSRTAGVRAARLLLDDIDVGAVWDRGDAMLESPRRWEIRLDLETFYGGAGVPVPNAPRFLVVETLEGVRIKTPLIWWRSASSLGEARSLAETAASGTPCPPELRCDEVVSQSASLHGLVFFGDGNAEGRDATSSGQRQPLSAVHTAVGFIPIGPVAGHAVGTVAQVGNLNCFAGCVQTASCTTSTVSVFAESAAEGPVWKKEEFSVSSGNLIGVRKPTNACARPSAGAPEAPEIPQLRFRRDYLPAELSRFSELGATPPEHEITLR